MDRIAIAATAAPRFAWRVYHVFLVACAMWAVIIWAVHALWCAL